MRKQIKEADFVLIVCTEVYERRFEGNEETGRSAGAKWEGAIVTQQLYEAEGSNIKFIPVVFSAEDTRYIPLEIRGVTFHIVENDKGYEGLYRQLTNQPQAVKGALGKLRSLPERERKQTSTPGASAEIRVARHRPQAVQEPRAAAATLNAPSALVLILPPDCSNLIVEALRIEIGRNDQHVPPCGERR